MTRAGVAGILSLLVPGFGQLYNRQYFRACFYAFLGGVLWCFGFCFVVHGLATYDGLFAGFRIREWGWVGRSIRGASSAALQGDTRALPVLPSGDLSPKLAGIIEAAQRADDRMHWVKDIEGNAYEGSLVIVVIWLSLIMFAPVIYAVTRRSQIRLRAQLERVCSAPGPEE